MQVHRWQPGSISSQSTQTSSVFSAEEEDYDSRIKEIEAYYIRTLLDEDEVGREEVDNKTLVAGSREDVVERSLVVPVVKPAVRAKATQQADVAPRALEVAINPQYMPATGVLPLTSENLKLLQNPKLAPHVLECATEQPVRRQAQKQQQQQQSQQQQQAHEKCNKVLYKTELCESFSTKGFCRYGNNCQFAHGLQELKFKERSNKFRTKPCVNWLKTGSCPYGQRCCFKHGNDQDIKVYLQASQAAKSSRISEQPRRNLHANVKALQKMAW